ncbi:response regulator [Pseudoalteromonas denitrificans]|uniref:Histidine kinase-, DNA gyrase B-, and HSP90-like ATPase n=1 Tax=Pseudoalteromonas denitrificans DSM 6059 TaxID=1123010 RepID=A0A1I1GK47_9GAMM|nr:response regulator [Pseudoalteromonas denitrificans]SFC11642.1 Histidine kinase-, DNA gyrase B-, and HSP90-like ATPase [Pseudoalteromonas denitrificans DSM 6059]
MLIIEPVENMRVTIAAMLVKLSFGKVIQAKNGAEALVILDKGHINIVISEYNLPKVNGIELLRHIRSNYETSRIPFVMLSSTIEQNEVLLAIQHGVSEYVVKPFSIKILQKYLISSMENPIKSTASLLSTYKENAITQSEIVQEKPVILVVDDVPDIIHVIADVLRKDYKVKGVVSGEKALKICQSKSQPDLILLDIMMPGMDGLELCKIIKTDPLTQHITIIFLTALNQPEKVVEGLSLGAVDYITKPINPKITKARVKTHINSILNQKLLRSQLDTMIDNISLRDEFDRIIQNDLKSPISHLLAGIEDILKSKKNSNVVATIAQSLKLSCSSLSQQVSNMGILYKIEDGSYKLSPEIFDLSLLVIDVIEKYSLLIERKNLELKTEFNGQHKVKGEASLTSSIISSLLQNAIEAAPNGSVIKLSLENKAQLAYLKLTNRGSIPQEMNKVFFEKYSTSGKKDASGIGTYSAKLMTEIQLGTIELNSSIQGETTINLSLPASN